MVRTIFKQVAKSSPRLDLKCDIKMKEIAVAGEILEVTLELSDGRDDLTVTQAVFVPPIYTTAALTLWYNIDVGGDGIYEVLQASTGDFVFTVGGDAMSVDIVGFVEDENGFRVDFNFPGVVLPEEMQGGAEPEAQPGVEEPLATGGGGAEGGASMMGG